MHDREFTVRLNEAEAAVREGDHDGALAALDALCRLRPDAHAETLLAACRYRAFVATPPQECVCERWHELPEEVFDGVVGIPEIGPSELDVRTLAAGIHHHGALLVRGLLPSARAGELADGVMRALHDCQAWHDGAPATPWYSRLDMEPDCPIAEGRQFGEAAWSVWACDSPRMLRELITEYEDVGLVDTLAAYFGEQPILSVGKTSLRRVPADIKMADWHQDGAFLGADIRSVDVWLSLSDCGEEASGLDIVPKRFTGIQPTGSHGAFFDWAVGHEMVEQVAGDAGVVSPHFAPGDALLFDHLFLHRTSIPAAIKRDRYAIEAWFFAPSAYPAKQVPLKV